MDQNNEYVQGQQYMGNEYAQGQQYMGNEYAQGQQYMGNEYTQGQQYVGNGYMQGQQVDMSQYGYVPVQPYVNMGMVEYEKPVTVGNWLISMLIMMIPFVNIVMVFVWAFGSSEPKSKSNFFKASLILVGIILGIYVLFFLLLLSLFRDFW